MDFIGKIEKELGVKITSRNSVGGGCIANSQKLEAEDGRKFFYKSYSGNDPSVLKTEANGLEELRKSGAIRIPEVVLLTDEFLLIEYIESGSKRNNFFEVFGRQFAEMHKYTGDKFGFYENNMIGATPQINLPRNDNWTEFYFNNRLRYQFELMEKNGYADGKTRELFGSIENKIEDILKESEEEPSLLHGDLWGGNYMAGENGEPCLIDPAVYYGHREADLAMTKVFGGFDKTFYDSYEEAWALPEGHEYRLNIYKLYHIMNHLNIFGSGYYSQTVSLMKYYA